MARGEAAVVGSADEDTTTVSIGANVQLKPSEPSPIPGWDLLSYGGCGSRWISRGESIFEQIHLNMSFVIKLIKMDLV